MYMTPGRGGSSPGQRNVILEGPITDFCSIIEETPAGTWQKRTAALQRLVEAIPEGSAYTDYGSAWYNSPPTLRHLARPVGELLKDPRSTVVKRTCESLTILFNRCQVDARYLFRDLMPTILSVHAQTVQVIRQAVQAMVVEAINEVPCKMVMPLWMERLKIDKSRTVRDACSLYLGQALQSWTEEGYLTDEIWMQVGKALLGAVRDPSPSVRVNVKAALEIVQSMQPEIWDALVNDPDGLAAKDPKLHRWLNGLGHGSQDAEELSVASRFSYNSDMRIRSKTSFSPSNNAGGPRRVSRVDEKEYKDYNSVGAVPTQVDFSNKQNHGLFRRSNLGPPQRRAVPFNLPNDSPQRPPVAPPKNIITNNNAEEADEDIRLADSFESALGDTASSDENEESLENMVSHVVSTAKEALESTADTEANEKPAPSLSTETLKPDAASVPEILVSKPRISAPVSSETKASNGEVVSSPSNGFPNDLDLPALRETIARSVQTTRQEAPKVMASSEQAAVAAELRPELKKPAARAGEVTQSSGHLVDIDDNPFIASADELRKFSKRRSRNSLMIKERFRQSSSSFLLVDDEDRRGGVPRSDEENATPNPADKKGFREGPAGKIRPVDSPSQAPEHMIIAIRLLKAHKRHVDTIMETLRIEMDTLRDFDRLLEEPGRPTEDEVLDYFESVCLCLDQRTSAGNILQYEMDRVSRGEPPLE